MIKLAIKLAIVALVVNATWRVGNAYLSHYRFVDAVTEAAQFAGSRSDGDLQSKIQELADQYGIPIAEDGFTLRRDRDHITVSGGYTKPIDVAPGYTYRWPFTIAIDVFSSAPTRLDLQRPAP